MTRAEAARRAGMTVDEWRSLERGEGTANEAVLRTLGGVVGTESRGPARQNDGWRHDARVREVLDHADPFYVAVEASGGIHVVPVNFARHGGRIWIFSLRGSLKERTLRRRPAVGGLVRRGDRAVMLTGRAELVDIPTARGLAPEHLFRLPVAAAEYAVRNRKALAGMVLYPPSPMSAPGLLVGVPLAIDVQRVALLERGRVVTAWGNWPGRAPISSSPLPAQSPAFDRLPAGLQRLLRQPARPAVLGWDSSAGPVPIPCVWHPDSAQFETDLSTLTLAGARDHIDGCAVVDRYSWRFKDHEGVLMAGRGRLTIDGDTAWASIDHRRLTYWHKEKHDTVWRRPEPSSAQ